MSFLSAAGAFSGGAAEGLDRGQLIAQRAQQIQQGQMALEGAKSQLRADAAAFAGLDAGGAQPAAGPGMSFAPGLPGPQGGAAPPQPYAQPMAPGQASVPARQPAVPQQQGFSPAAQPQSSASPPSPSPQPGGGGLSAPGGQQEIDPTDPRAAVQTVMQIAREIKSRNPNIAPQDLMLATSRVIDMSKGLAPALRQGAQVVVQQLRNEGALARTDAQVAGRENVAGMNIESREGIAANRDVTTRRGQDAMLQRVQAQGAQALERAALTTAAANERAAQGAWSREKVAAYRERTGAATAKLNAAQKQLSSLQSALVPADDPRAQAAVKAQAQAIAELDRVTKAAGLAEGPAPGAGAARPAPAGVASARGPAPAQLRGKPIWPQGDKWVFEDGTEAK